MFEGRGREEGCSDGRLCFRLIIEGGCKYRSRHPHSYPCLGNFPRMCQISLYTSVSPVVMIKNPRIKPDVHKEITFCPHDAVDWLTGCASDCTNRETLRDRLVGTFIALGCFLSIHID